MKFKNGIELIRTALSKPLPGEDAQMLMAPIGRKSRTDYLREQSQLKYSSVLMLLFPDHNGVLNTIFIERPHDDSIHSGQIAFPGGKVEESDTSLSQTAVRETEEEIGVAANRIEIAGSLTPLIIPASNYLVHPYIGIVEDIPEFKPNPIEVHSILTVSITEIMSLTPQQGVFKTSYVELPAPYYPLMGHKLWGATSIIVSEFREMMREIL